MTLAAALLGCRMCGENRFVQVVITREHVGDDGDVRVDAEVVERDREFVQMFWASHRLPFAMATR